MKKYKVEQIRNVGFVGHGASGKTSLAEAILYASGVSDRLGKVGDSSSVMDYDPDEIKRGHSINASIALCEWNKHKINLIDAPGNSNFIADTPSSLRVVDGAVVVVSAADGVQFYTEKVWKWAEDEGLPKIIFINKIDHERANLQAVMDSIKKKFKKSPVLLQIPVGSGEGFTGLVDLVENVYRKYDKSGKGLGESGEAPQDAVEDVEIIRAELVENVAESDDELIEKYLETGELSNEDFNSGLKKGVLNGELIPVVCGSATLNMGVDVLLDAIVEYLPSPVDRPQVKGKSTQDDSEVVVKSDEAAPLSALVFKTVADPYAGKLTLFRVFSGTLKGDSSVFNSTQNVAERVGQVFGLQGKKQVPVGEISAGDIGAVAKLKTTTTGDSLCAQEHPVVFAPISFPHPVMARAMVPKTRADEEKISTALHRLAEEDPTLKIERDPQTHDLLVSGMGQVHLDVVIECMKRRFGVEVDLHPPKVPYRETLRGRTKVQGKYKKQTGGRGQYGDTWLEISPLPKGEGFVFENKIVGGAIPKTYIPAVEKGVMEAMAQGVLAGYPMVDVKVSLYDGSYHDVDSSEMAFKIAGSMGFKKGVMDCKPILLEPIMEMEVNVPSEYVGDVMGDLNSKRGKVMGIEAGEADQSVKALIPMAEVLNYSVDLTAMTGGRGAFAMEFSGYQDVPDHIAQKVIETAKAAKKHE